MLAEYLDPTYLRQHLSFWFLTQIGVPAPFDYPVRVQMNGEFYQLAFHSDVLGQEQLERMGYDPNGALYKGEILGAGRGPMTERKDLDPNGQMFDITTAQHAKETGHIDEGQ